MQKNRTSEARLLFTRALQSVSKHKHIFMISKFGQLEFKCGSVERGRTIFEGLVRFGNLYCFTITKLCILDLVSSIIV